MLFELFYSRRYINNNRLRVGIYLLISLLFFSFSALRIDRSELNRPSFDDLVQVVNPSAVSDSISSLAEEKDTVRVFFSFYLHYGRLESTDPTANWRLDIWQDVLFDMAKEGRVLTGYGYNEIFPQMLDPTAPGRLGRDGMNEHVHNYFVNIFGRGGILQLLFFLIFHFGIIQYWKKRKSKLSNFDVCFTSFNSFIARHYNGGSTVPNGLLFFLYYFLKNSTKVKVIELYG